MASRGAATTWLLQVQRDAPRLEPYRLAGFAILAVAMLILTVAVLLGGTAGLPQQRSAFRVVVTSLRSDVSACDAAAARAVEAALSARSQSSVGGAERLARRAETRCGPNGDNAIWDLTVYSVPPSLPTRLRLGYAVSCLGVWAQEDVAPAMAVLRTLLRDPGNGGAAAQYRRLSSWARQSATAANAALSHAAKRLGVTFRALRLITLPTELALPAAGAQAARAQDA